MEAAFVPAIKKPSMRSEVKLHDESTATRMHDHSPNVHFLDAKTHEVLHTVAAKMSTVSDEYMQIIRLWVQETTRDTDLHESTQHSALVLSHKSLIGRPRVESIDKEQIHAISPNIEFGEDMSGRLIRFKFDPRYLASENLFLNTPNFALQLSEYVKRESSLVVLVVALPTFDAAFSNVCDRLELENAHNPVNQWKRADQHRPRFIISRMLKPSLRPKMRRPYETRHTFRDFQDFCTVLGLAMVMEKEYSDSKAEKYRKTLRPMRVVQIPGSGENEWFIVLSVSDDDEIRIQPGDFLKIKIHGHEDNWTEAYSARVTERIPDMPVSMLCAIMHRPWSREIADWSDDSVLDTIKLEDFHGLESDAVFDRIKSYPAQEVIVMRMSSDKVFTQNLFALEQLSKNDPAKMCGRLQHAQRLLLPATRLDQLEMYDIFASVRDEERNVEVLMTLNPTQLNTILNAKLARGGLKLVLGSSKTTSKMDYVKQCATAFLRHSEHRPILVLCPTNAGADDMTDSLVAHILDLQSRNLVPAFKYAIRCHSEATTRDILMQKARLERGPDADARPTFGDLSEEDEQLIENVALAKAIFDCRNQAIATKFELIRDRRVAKIEHSLGHVMGQMADVFPGGPKCRDPKTFLGFNNILGEYQNEQTAMDFSKDDMAFLIMTANKLRDYTLRHAAIIITTVSNAGTHQISSVCQDETRAIFIDEAARISEPDLFPIFATPYRLLDGIVMMADPQQESTFVESPIESNYFAEQLGISLFTRLQSAGFETDVLDDEPAQIVGDNGKDNCE